MQKMRDSMNKINDGFFYNKSKKIMEGLGELRSSNKVFGSPAELKKYLPKKVSHMAGMSFNTVTKINNHIGKMEKYVSKNNFRKASSEYTNIINNCTSCHAIVRGW